MQQVEFHFDFGSPNAFLAHRAIRVIEARARTSFRYVPVLLGGVFKSTNNVSPAVSLKGVINKPEYARIETKRWLARYGVEEYMANPHFPVNTLLVMRGAAFAEQTNYYDRYIEAIYVGMWQKALKMDEPEVIAGELSAADLPVDEIVSAMSNADVKQKLIDSTASSVARGTFGSPTFFLGEEIYFGKETLRDIEEAVS